MDHVVQLVCLDKQDFLVKLEIVVHLAILDNQVAQADLVKMVCQETKVTVVFLVCLECVFLIRVLMFNLANQDQRVQKENAVHLDHPDIKDHPVCLVFKDRKVTVVLMVYLVVQASLVEMV